MDESDSDAEPQRDRDQEDPEKYPVEGIFISIAEKHKIMALPELRREEFIADRAAKAERSRQNRLLRQLVNVQESEEKKQGLKKRSADTAELEDNHRKSARPRTRLDGTKVGETSAGIDSLRKARAEKSDRERRRAEDRERNKDRSSPISNRGRESRASSEDRRNDIRGKESPPREQPPAELRDFERVRAGRRQFAERCFDPGFEKALTGCYVRINMANDSNGQPVYRMALIKGRWPGSHSARGLLLTTPRLYIGQTLCYDRPRWTIRDRPVRCHCHRQVESGTAIHHVLGQPIHRGTKSHFH